MPKTAKDLAVLRRYKRTVNFRDRYLAHRMKDKNSQAKTAEHRQGKANTGQGDLNRPQRSWQDVAQLLRLLISKQLVLNHYQDPSLINNLQVLHKALCAGDSVEELQTLMQDISACILELERAEQKTSLPELNPAADTHNNEDQIRLICDVFLLLLDNINFPVNFSSKIEQIKSIIKKPNDLGMQTSFLTGITDLAEVLDDIFDTVKQDKQNIEKYLKQVAGEIQSLDEGILTSNRFQSEKQTAEETINSMVETEVLEMENSMTTLVDIDDVKMSLQKSLGTIREHMGSFLQQEQLRNQQAKEITDRLGRQLKKMEQECHELKNQILEKHEQTLSDSLTGVRNRFAYDEAIKNEMERFKRYARPVSILLLDLDNFKTLNDTHGHGIGDQALKFVTKILAKNIRSVDFLARYGGDEFIIIFPELGINEAKITANKLCKAIANTKLEHKDLSLKLTVSGGISQLRDEDTVESLFERADDALYTAKKRGRNRCEAKLY